MLSLLDVLVSALAPHGFLLQGDEAPREAGGIAMTQDPPFSFINFKKMVVWWGESVGTLRSRLADSNPASTTLNLSVYSEK